MADQNFDQDELRRAFGSFLTGVTIITMTDPDGAPRGMTANSFTSVSLSPAMLLVCVGRHSSNYAAFGEASSFAVHVLGSEHVDTAKVFATRGADRFGRTSHRVVATGAPVLTGCMAWFDCSVLRRVEAGDHTIFIGEVQAFGAKHTEPLVFFGGKFMTAGTRAEIVSC